MPRNAAIALFAVVGMLWREPWGPTVVSAAADNIRELITAARGAPAAVCGLAADAVGSGWGGAFSDAPVTPLGRRLPRHTRGHRRYDMSSDDVRFLLENLSTGDACVRELAVRLLGTQGGDEVGPGLLQRLASPDSAMRSVAALGLGLAETHSAVDALAHTVRDPSTGTRANAVWALGRMDDGRAVGPVTAALDDDSPLVREAAAGALGHLDSASAVPALLRILKGDPVASVRRTAAWALGQLEASGAADGLVAALRGDKDAEVREMSAWALGNMEIKHGADALLAAAKGDQDDRVRETAVWALGEHGDASVAGALGDLLAAEKNIEVRATAAWALGQLEVEKAPKGLIDAVGDTDTDVRTRAAWALSEIGDGAAIPALRVALEKERDPEARKAEVRALIHSGERSDRLTELLESKDPGDTRRGDPRRGWKRRGGPVALAGAKATSLSVMLRRRSLSTPRWSDR